MSNNVLTKEQLWGKEYLKMLKDKKCILAMAKDLKIKVQTIENRIIKYLETIDVNQKNQEYEFMLLIPNTVYFDFAQKILTTKISNKDFFELRSVIELGIKIVKSVLSVRCSHLRNEKNTQEQIINAEIYLNCLKGNVSLVIMAECFDIREKTLERRIIEYLETVDINKKTEEYDFMFLVPDTFYFDLAKKLLKTKVPHKDFYKINKMLEKTIDIVNEILMVDCSYLKEKIEEIEMSKKNIKANGIVKPLNIAKPTAVGVRLGRWSY